ncbi:MAG: RelA/SpoT family protein [Burkholderiales bacterium]
MKTTHSNSFSSTIVQWVDAQDDASAGEQALVRARNFAQPLLQGQILHSGEGAQHHADGIAGILKDVGAAPSMRAAVYLVYAADYLQNPEEIVSKAFGPTYASLMVHTRKLVQIQRAARKAQVGPTLQTQQTERVRKMLLAFSQDLRVVLLRLASRLQTLRYYAQSKRDCPRETAEESLHVFAPLANRLGIWQIKWEMEDLSFRFLQPEHYRHVAMLLDERRVEREAGVELFRQQLSEALAAHRIQAEVQGRPKHIYSIWKKMQGKGLAFPQVLDVRAMRVIVNTVADCYAVLGQVHALFKALDGAFDDYIARPKPNGYQSLHTVVLDDRGRTVEVQIRTREMHHHAEFGMASHWAYKEAGVKGYAGVRTNEAQAQLNEARKAVLRQLLAWEHEFVAKGEGVSDAHLYVFTPQAEVLELTAGATPVDFAYAVHTSLGHRCRGAKVDGVLVPLNTVLQSGQTVEITTVKEGGPSLDWLQPQLGFLRSARARAKVRAWFNAQIQQQTIARGREAVEKVLQREGKTALNFEGLAAQLGFASPDEFFEVVGKDEFSLRHIEDALRPPTPANTSRNEFVRLRPPGKSSGHGEQVSVAGVNALFCHLARCCRPAPPDRIGGFVTRGKGVAVHRLLCSNWAEMTRRSPERVIEVDWTTPGASQSVVLYPVDIMIQATDRPGLLRDVSEIFAKEKMNVIGVKTQTVKDPRGATAWMTFTVEMPDLDRLDDILLRALQVGGVRSAHRR